MAWSSRSSGPWCMDPSSLETWYNTTIRDGTGNFASDCRKVINDVVKSVQRVCSSGVLNFNVSRIVKGGSLGKGTMVKDLSDIDLVAFIKTPDLAPIVTLGPSEYRRKLTIVIKELYTALKKPIVPFVSDVRKDEYMVKFNVTVGSRLLNVDFLPTSDNFAGFGRSHSDMFRAMLQLDDDKERGFYSASLVEHQVSFVGSRPGNVKALVRLVKYWASDFLPDYLQKSYPLELITIHLWEKAGEPIRFSKAQGLKNVLQVLTRLKELRVTSWSGSNMYDSAMAQAAITQLKLINPIVLDPANPTNNVCYLYQQPSNGRGIASAAEQTLQTDLLRNVTVYQGWRGKGRPQEFI